MARSPVIRRYPGGRLYDPAALRYVSLAELRALRGEVRVVDAATGEDVTAALLG